ncbi:MAG: hypothetical protein ACRBCI_13785 [Cellvibrionaceae bacterium]
MAAIEPNTLYQLLKHGYNWLSNLRRAKSARKQESVIALRRVITASRETAVYLRQYQESKKRIYKIERGLTLLWTELGFALDDLGLSKLAKRCQVTGKHWSDPAYYEEAFLEKADISLDRMERLAKELLLELEA